MQSTERHLATLASQEISRHVHLKKVVVGHCYMYLLTLPSCLLLVHSSACLFQLGTQLTDFCPLALHVLNLLLQCGNGSCLSVCIHITVVKVCCMLSEFNSCSCAGDTKECLAQAQTQHHILATMIYQPPINIGLDNLSLQIQSIYYVEA